MLKVDRAVKRHQSRKLYSTALGSLFSSADLLHLIEPLSYALSQAFCHHLFSQIFSVQYVTKSLVAQSSFFYFGGHDNTNNNKRKKMQCNGGMIFFVIDLLHIGKRDMG